MLIFKNKILSLFTNCSIENKIGVDIGTKALKCRVVQNSAIFKQWEIDFLVLLNIFQ